MAIQIGIRLGPYEIVSHLGAGGMGEVWRAKDTRLDREVAIKDFPNLPTETKWEPHIDLFKRSLEDTYLTIERQSTLALESRGYLVLEIGYGQSERLQKVFDFLAPLR